MLKTDIRLSTARKRHRNYTWAHQFLGVHAGCRANSVPQRQHLRRHSVGEGLVIETTLVWGTLADDDP